MIERESCRAVRAACDGSGAQGRARSAARIVCLSFCTCCALLLLAAWGCSKGDAPAPVNAADDAVTAGLAELAPEDRAAAEAQGICPVSNEKLGSMGKPYVVEIKGRKVFLCCQGCEDALRSDPDKYLAILDEG